MVMKGDDLMDLSVMEEEPEILRDRGVPVNNFLEDNFQLEKSLLFEDFQPPGITRRIKRREFGPVLSPPSKVDNVLHPESKLVNVAQKHRGTPKCCMAAILAMSISIPIIMKIGQIAWVDLEFDEQAVFNQSIWMLREDFDHQTEDMWKRVERSFNTSINALPMALMLVPEDQDLDNSLTLCLMVRLANLFSIKAMRTANPGMPKVWTTRNVGDSETLRKVFWSSLEERSLFAFHEVDSMDTNMANTLDELMKEATRINVSANFVFSLSELFKFGGHPSLVARFALETKWDGLNRRNLNNLAAKVSSNAVRVRKQRKPECC